jgi:hypothetical protein
MLGYPYPGGIFERRMKKLFLWVLKVEANPGFFPFDSLCSPRVRMTTWGREITRGNVWVEKKTGS